MTLPSLAAAPWLNKACLQAVFAALAGAGYDARAVGGSVRNSLLGLPVKDVDIATPALPEAVIDAVHKAGLKSIPTGLKHGTITVIANHTPYEVTTLRRDEETDGRHATVAFTNDWAQDASRRDFTINALYCDRHGHMFDPLDGYADIVARRVRFIGRADDRIKEDYLRILRFFRFTSEYGDAQPDADGLAACASLKDGIQQLSGERLRAEMFRILSTLRAVEIAQVMDTARILPLVLGHESQVQRLERLAKIEDTLDLPTDELVRLGALAVDKLGDAQLLRRHLRLSNDEYERLTRMVMPDPAFDPSKDEVEAKAFIYRHGPQAFRDGVIMEWARSSSAAHDSAFKHRFNLAQRWRAPERPVNGTDVIALGLESGPSVGKALSAFEDWWIATDFPSDTRVLAAKLSEIVKVTKA
jgi:poly(A) polymerase